MSVTTENITVICYGKEVKWTNRNQALSFYAEAIASTDGHEQERYINIYNDLLEGLIYCTDRAN